MASKRNEELKEVAKSIFSGLAFSYDAVLDWATLMQDRCWKRWALHRVDPKGSDLLLDVGSGTCVTEERLRGRGCRVVGVDLTSEMLDFGKSKRLPGVHLLRGDAEALPFPDALFDAVISFYVVKYCDLGVFVSELSRVLKEGGRLVVYDFARPRGLAAPALAFYIYAVLRVAGWVARRVGAGIWVTFEELPVIIRRTDWEVNLPLFAASSGLVIEEQAGLSGGAVRAFSLRKKS